MVPSKALQRPATRCPSLAVPTPPHMPPAAFFSRNLAMGDPGPSGSSSSSLVLGSSTNTTVTPCSGSACGSLTCSGGTRGGARAQPGRSGRWVVRRCYPTCPPIVRPPLTHLDPKHVPVFLCCFRQVRHRYCDVVQAAGGGRCNCRRQAPRRLQGGAEASLHSSSPCMVACPLIKRPASPEIAAVCRPRSHLRRPAACTPGRCCKHPWMVCDQRREASEAPCCVQAVACVAAAPNPKQRVRCNLRLV